MLNDPLELAGVLTGLVAVALTVRRNIWCWPLGMVNVALFAIVFRRAGLYADAGLQVVYFVLCAYGWWHWSRGGPRGGELAVTRAPRHELALALGVAGAAALLLGALLARLPTASWPWLDAALAAGSLAAQWLQARKRVENWAIWIVVDVIYVALYLVKELVATALLYALFAVLATAGWWSWRRAVPAPVAAQSAP